MKVAYKTDVGKQRTHNEDSILIDMCTGIFLLADGLGGHQAGEVASNLAVKESYTYLKENLNKVKSEGEVLKLLTESLLKAHNTIRAKSMADINLMGMGTTLIQMLIKDSSAYICHVGDSRVYFFREEIKQITKDHTFENYLMEDEIIQREYLPLQKLHILTQAVGESETIVPELKQVKLKAEDMLLACSDGLTDMLSGKEVESIIYQYRDNLNTAVDSLIKEANNKGGMDNISVILIKYE
ncbi:MAG: protein phosphatase 2C domain-containing protein [Candidatus Jettenia sp. CY-1]|nr:MAG: protein phosphatase 2C domain-containing protein [Candidatus Jettenia sp. CY-1]